MATLDVFRSTVAAAALGMARRAMDETLEHVSQRKLFGGTLSDLQLVQGKLSDMAVAVDTSALLVYRSAWTKDCIADRVTREAAMANCMQLNLHSKLLMRPFSFMEEKVLREDMWSNLSIGMCVH